MSTIFVVTMLRWGNDESHHYIIGAFSSEQKAIDAGNVERDYRGFKYEPKLTECKIDEFVK